MEKIKELDLPEELQSALNDFLKMERAILKDSLVGVYLQGSLAIGDFDQYSDVDFIIVTKDDLNERELQELRAFHEQFPEKKGHWYSHFEGSYFPLLYLQDHKHSRKEVWYVDHGSQVMIRSNHCNTMVVRHSMLQGGVVLFGPDPKSLIPAISRDLLLEEICQVMGDWADEILQNPGQYDNHFYQVFILQSYCRVLHSLKTGRVSSKKEAVEYVRSLSIIPEDLLDRSFEGRVDPSKAVARKPPGQDYQFTLQFLKLALEKIRNYQTGGNDE